MKVKMHDKIEYIVADPTHNYTILVLSEVDIIKQPEVSSTLMNVEKEVEQVGFISFDSPYDMTLRMAGGEFCGNATMSTAVYYAISNGLEATDVKIFILDIKKVVSVNVKLVDSIWTGVVDMPKPLSIKEINIDDYKNLPIVEFDGISHIVIEDKNKYMDLNLPDIDYKTNLQNHNAKLNALIKFWCMKLNLKALGIMFYEETTSRIIPVVYVREVDTLFVENSCASGTAAVGAYLAKKTNESIEKNFFEPGGNLKIIAEHDKKLLLCGSVKFLE